jgi:hypothetical protein
VPLEVGERQVDVGFAERICEHALRRVPHVQDGDRVPGEDLRDE